MLLLKCVDNLIIPALFLNYSQLFPNYSRIIPEFPKLFPHNSHKPMVDEVGKLLVTDTLYLLTYTCSYTEYHCTEL